MDETFAAEIAQRLADVPSHATGVLFISLRALSRNYVKLRDMAPTAETAAVLKANGYGLGATEVAVELERAGCRTFFVATLAEAQTLRACCINPAIYVLDGLLPGTAPLFGEIEARPVLGSLDEIGEWKDYCARQGVRRPAAIHLDTGMTRLGLPPNDFRRLAQSQDTFASFDPSLILSHLCCADDAGSAKNDIQRSQFEKLAALFPNIPSSLANSAGIFLGREFHAEMTRPGIALYGGRARLGSANPMEPVVWLFGRIVQVRWAEAGETVGYGGTQTLRRRTRIATVSAGYADGYIRAASSSDAKAGAPGFIGQYRLPLIGRVSMDLATFDATDSPEDLVKRGGWVQLLGEQFDIDDFADLAGTIGYEVLTSLGRRYDRIYLHG